MFSGCSFGRPSGFCPSVRCPLTRISCDAMYLYTVEALQWKLAQIFIMWIGIDVAGLRSKCSFATEALRRDWLVHVAVCLAACWYLSSVIHSFSSSCCAISWRVVISGDTVHFSTLTLHFQLHVCISHRIYEKLKIASWESWRQLPYGKANMRDTTQVKLVGTYNVKMAMG